MKDSDFPTIHTASHIEDMFWTEEERAEAQSRWGPDLYSEKYHQRLRSLYIQHIPGYAEAITEEIEAQLHYNENRHTKKSHPKERYYPARERLYKARHAVNHLTHKFYTSDRTLGYVNAMYDRAAYIDNDPIKTALNRQIEEEWREAHPSEATQAKRRSQNKETFEDWLREERQLYETALAEPWLVSSLFASPEEVYRKRLEYLESLQETLDQKGLDEAFTRHNTIIEVDTDIEEEDTEVLTAQVLETSCTDEFVSLAHKTASGKTGYWEHSTTNFRPLLLDPVKDTKEIERRKQSYNEMKQVAQHTDDRRRGIDN